MKPKSTPTPFGLVALSTLVAVAALLLWKSLFWGWIFDDSYIAFRFADNWATLGELTWNPGDDPVEGFTSFAWVLVGAFLRRATGAPPHVSMILVGVACWIALMVFLLPRMIETVNGSLDVPGFLTVLALAANPYLGFHAFHGLETALHVLVLALVVYLALREPARGNEVALVMASLLAVMVRPDAVAFVLPLWGIRIVYGPRRRAMAGLAALAIALSLYTLVKWQWSGYPLPNTFYIKQGGLLSGLGYVKTYLTALSPLWLFLAFAAGRAGTVRLLRDRTFLILALPAIAFCLAYVKLNPILGQGYRFLIPTLPLIALACLRACILSEARVAYGLAMLATAGLFGSQMYREHGGLQSYFRAIDRNLVSTGRKLAGASALSPPPLLATGDVGAIPYFSKLPTLDLIGLADETVAHEGLTHAYLLRRNPDLLILQDLYLRADGGGGELDRSRYRDILAAPEKAHSGAGSTFQVVTLPSFATRYARVADWDFAGIDRYYVFIRRDYAHFHELVRIVQPHE